MTASSRDDGLRIARTLRERVTQPPSPLPIMHVYLFGSVVRGDATPESDVDLAIVCEPFERSKVKEARAIYERMPDLDPRVDLLILHPEDVSNTFSSVAQAVKREGIEVGEI